MSVHMKTKRTLTLIPFQPEPYFSAFSDSHIILPSLMATALLLCSSILEIALLWLSILTVFNSSPPIFSWTHCTKPILVKVTNDLYVTKSNSLFLVLISPSMVLIIWLSKTVWILLPSQRQEATFHQNLENTATLSFLDGISQDLDVGLLYLHLLPGSLSHLIDLNKNVEVFSVVLPVPVFLLNSRLIYPNCLYNLSIWILGNSRWLRPNLNSIFSTKLL